MPESFVFFGILHEILVASVLALPFLRVPFWVTAIVAAAVIAAPQFLTSPFFDAPVLLPLGLAAHPVETVDYVPLFPWFGVVLAGLAAGRLFVDLRLDERLAGWSPVGMFWRLLLRAGRWSLAVYLIHQPLLIGILYAVTALTGQSQSALAGRFLNECTMNCRNNGEPADFCATSCQCIASGLEQSNLLGPVMAGRVTDDMNQRWQAVLDRCLAPQSDAAPGG